MLYEYAPLPPQGVPGQIVIKGHDPEGFLVFMFFLPDPVHLIESLKRTKDRFNSPQHHVGFVVANSIHRDPLKAPHKVVRWSADDREGGVTSVTPYNDSFIQMMEAISKLPT